MHGKVNNIFFRLTKFNFFFKEISHQVIPKILPYLQDFLFL